MTTDWRIREATVEDSDALARVQLRSWRTAYANLLPADYLAHFTHAEQAQDWRDMLSDETHDPLYVAESAAGEVVGYVLGRTEASWDGPYTSELVALHVLQPYQRQGIGRGLIAAVAAELKRQGHSALMLSVLAANPARAFYERLGGRLLGEKQVEIWEHTIAAEVVYGWDDIARLCASFGKGRVIVIENADPQSFQNLVAQEIRLLQGRLADWRLAAPYADHLRPLDPLERREAERLYRQLRQDRAASGEGTRERVARERRQPWSEEERWTLRKRVWRERRDRERELLEEREQLLLEREEELQHLLGYHQRWLDDLQKLEPGSFGWCAAQSHLREEQGITPDMLDQLQRRRKAAAERHARMLLANEHVHAALGEVTQSQMHDPFIVARAITP